jgi:hypothetical protein
MSRRRKTLAPILCQQGLDTVGFIVSPPFQRHRFQEIGTPARLVSGHPPSNQPPQKAVVLRPDLKFAGRCLAPMLLALTSVSVRIEIFAVGARLVAGRKQNPPGGPRISAPPFPRPGRKDVSWVERDALRHMSEFVLFWERWDRRHTTRLRNPFESDIDSHSRKCVSDDRDAVRTARVAVRQCPGFRWFARRPGERGPRFPIARMRVQRTS